MENKIKNELNTLSDEDLILLCNGLNQGKLSDYALEKIKLCESDSTIYYALFTRVLCGIMSDRLAKKQENYLILANKIK